MAKPKQSSTRLLAVTAKTTTIDGGRIDFKGEWPPLTVFTVQMLLSFDPKAPSQQHAMLVLLKEMEVDLPDGLRSRIVEQFGVLGEGLLRDFDAKEEKEDGRQ